MCTELSCWQSLYILTESDVRGQDRKPYPPIPVPTPSPALYKKQVKASERYNGFPKATWLVSDGVRPKTSISVASSKFPLRIHLFTADVRATFNTFSCRSPNQLKSFLASLNGKRVFTDTLLIIYLYEAVMYCSGVNGSIPWEGGVGK